MIIWAVAVGFLVGVISLTFLVKTSRPHQAALFTSTLQLQVPVTGPTGSAMRMESETHPGISSDHVPAAPGIFSPDRGGAP
jgi:hypothetical protein